MRNIATTPPDRLAENAVYQINPRTFSKEGTLAAVIGELPFIKETGFNIIYLCPIFEMDGSIDKNHFSSRQKASNSLKNTRIRYVSIPRTAEELVNTPRKA